jgi:hypothetical protein
MTNVFSCSLLTDDNDDYLVFVFQRFGVVGTQDEFDNLDLHLHLSNERLVFF